jgi:hypothetical protein
MASGIVLTIIRKRSDRVLQTHCARLCKSGNPPLRREMETLIPVKLNAADCVELGRRWQGHPAASGCLRSCEAIILKVE